MHQGMHRLENLIKQERRHIRTCVHDHDGLDSVSPPFRNARGIYNRLEIRICIDNKGGGRCDISRQLLT